MTEYCRLCAELKEPTDIVTSITDVAQLMEQKLWACCQWTHENTEQLLPHSVCTNCLDALDKCWLFSQKVQLAQQKLLHILRYETEIETKPLVTVIIPRAHLNLDYSANLLPSSYETLEATTAEYNYSEYYTDHYSDIETSRRLEELNDLHGDTYSEYFEEEKYDITSTQAQLPDNYDKLISSQGERNSSINTNPYQCDICAKQLSSKSSLKRHRSIHTKEKPFECFLCSKVFRLKIYLTEHMLVHTCTPDERAKLSHANRMKRAKRAKRKSPKRYQKNRITCIECGDEFSRNATLIKHIRLTHPNKSKFRCEECGRCYKYRASLNKHQKQLNHLKGDAKKVQKNHESDVENSLDYKISALFSMIMTGDEIQPDEKVKVKRSIKKPSNELNKHQQEVHATRSLRNSSRSASSKQQQQQETKHLCAECGECFPRKCELEKHFRLKHLQSHGTGHAAMNTSCSEEYRLKESQFESFIDANSDDCIIKTE